MANNSAFAARGICNDLSKNRQICIDTVRGPCTETLTLECHMGMDGRMDSRALANMSPQLLRSWWQKNFTKYANMVHFNP